MCQLFDYHEQGVADSIRQLSSDENHRLCSNSPNIPYAHSPSEAFYRHRSPADYQAMCRQLERDDSTATAGARDRDPYDHAKGLSIQRLFDPTPTMDGESEHLPHLTTELGETPAFRPESQYILIPPTVDGQVLDDPQKRLDMLFRNQRLPALNPHGSMDVFRGAPLLFQRNGVYLNAVAGYEHMCLVLEMLLRASRVPGLSGNHEYFPNQQAPPPGLSGLQPGASGAAEPCAVAGAEESGPRYTLSLSADCTQIGWTMRMMEQLYNSELTASVGAFNEHIKARGLDAQSLGGLLDHDNLVQFSTRFCGFQREESRSATGRSSAMLRAVTCPMAAKPPAPTDAGTNTSGQEFVSRAEQEYEASIALGRVVTSDAEVDAFLQQTRASAGGGLKGSSGSDIFDFATWREHHHVAAVRDFNTRAPMPRKSGAAQRAKMWQDDPALALKLLDEPMLSVRLMERAANKHSDHQYTSLRDLRLQIPRQTCYSADKKDAFKRPGRPRATARAAWGGDDDEDEDEDISLDVGFFGARQPVSAAGTSGASGAAGAR
tara:strand:+ start:140 stop:1780 length:1641 start_codon:yes stop_codon:yes gene_type:complete